MELNFMKLGFRKYFIALIIIPFVLFCNINLIFADHNTFLYERGNKYFQDNKYDEAILSYEEIIQNGYANWQLYYNLGNAYYKTGKLGKAILNYERAYELNPVNEDVIFNLELANTRAVDNIVTPPLVKSVNKVKYFFGMKTVTWLTLCLYFSFAFLIVIRILIRKRSIQRFAKIIIVPVAIVLILMASLFLIRVHENSTVKYAILLSEKVDVTGSPAEDGTVLFSLHEGVKFKVEDIQGNWAKIRLADGNVGWIKNKLFEII